MKILVASDIHGSKFYTQRIIEQATKEKADKIILLGDVYNHGPRNPFPKDYNPMAVADLLNGIKEKLIVVKGNCDSEVDSMISQFDFIENVLLISGGKTFYLTHGHVNNIDVPTKTKYDYIIYGHYHTGFIKVKDGTTYVNVGSVSLPKENTPSSYVIIENGDLVLKDIDGNIIKD